MGHSHLPQHQLGCIRKRVPPALPGQTASLLQTPKWLVAYKQNSHQRKKIPSPLFSRCTQHPETHNYVLRFEHAQQIRLQLWNKVTTVLTTDLMTPTQLQDALEFGIRSWQEGDTDIHWPFPFPSGSDPIDNATLIAFHYQTTIG